MTSNLIFEAILCEVSIRDDFDLILFFLIGLYSFLFILRLLKVLKKRTCPSCSGKLSRKQRNPLDKILTALTLNIMPFRRYKCVHCGWEGLRWSGRKHKSSSAY